MCPKVRGVRGFSLKSVSIALHEKHVKRNLKEISFFADYGLNLSADNLENCSTFSPNALFSPQNSPKLLLKKTDVYLSAVFCVCHKCLHPFYFLYF